MLVQQLSGRRAERDRVAVARAAVERAGHATGGPDCGTGFLATSLVLWAVSLRSIDLRRVTDVGLISALPPTFLPPRLLLLTVSFGLAVAGPRLVPLLFLQLGVQVLILFGTPSFIEYGPRTESAWRLAGIVDYIAQNHSIDRGIDAFFNWPGFFILVAFLTDAAGLTNSLELARGRPSSSTSPTLPLRHLSVLAMSDRQSGSDCGYSWQATGSARTTSLRRRSGTSST